ncbi:MAG: glycosyltransferase, partial [Planctomycetota bacterium]|nr:glycosyltransferase [Planctomycetota bacterium]
LGAIYESMRGKKVCDKHVSHHDTACAQTGETEHVTGEVEGSTQPARITKEQARSNDIDDGRAASATGSERQLTVCHIISSLHYGGAERQFVNTLVHLPGARKIAVTLTADPAMEALGKLLPKDVRVFELGARARHLPLSVWKLARLLKEQQVDVVHTHMYWANLYGVLAARVAGVPVVVTSEHGKNPWKHAGHRWVERTIISRWSDMRVCVSEDILRIRRDVERVPADKLMHIPNGTGIPAPAEYKDARPVVIGSVGRFIEAKDHLTLVRAAAHLRDANREIKLFLVGDGPLRPRLEQEIADLNLQAIVQLSGFQQNITDWLRRMDVFVMSSVREGQPVALLEAMAHGLPVVATRVGGIPDTVSERQEGLLVDASDPAALADALAQLVDDPERRQALGTRARQRVVKDFSIQTSCQRYLDLYRGLLSRNGNGAV